MKSITYKNTQTPSGWVSNLHESLPRGYAYETNTHFIHIYGAEDSLWVMSPGMATAQAKEGSLDDWARQTFGAEEIEILDGAVGQTTAGVWRPGISHYDHIRQGLSTTDNERHAALQAVRLLLERLDELFLYIEPCPTSLDTYSNKTRELLILACTEVENTWQHYMRAAQHSPSTGRGFTTNDYIRLLAPLRLSEFELVPKPYSIPPSQPFLGWSATQPSKSLTWYDAYNLTKHDRHTHFDKATLKTCIDAVCAHLVMFSVRFSPYPLYHEGGTVTALFRQLFDIGLRGCSPTSFYVPFAQLPANQRSQLTAVDIQRLKYLQPWSVQPLTL